MFIPVSKTVVNWDSLLQAVPRTLITEFDAKGIKFDNLGTYLRLLERLSNLHNACKYVHYTFAFRLNMAGIFELNNCIHGNVSSEWESDLEQGVIEADLNQWRNFILSAQRPELRKLANIIYQYFVTEKIAVILFPDYKIESDKSNFKLVRR